MYCGRKLLNLLPSIGEGPEGSAEFEVKQCGVTLWVDVHHNPSHRLDGVQSLLTSLNNILAIANRFSLLVHKKCQRLYINFHLGGRGEHIGKTSRRKVMPMCEMLL